MNEILQYLKENQGRPIFINDIYQAFPGYDKKTLNSEVQNLIFQGLIYPYDNAYYLTKWGLTKIENPEAKYDPYTRIRNQHKDISYETRDQYWDKWLNHFLGTLEFFKKNHPELEDLFNILGVTAKEDIGRWHDATEFAKDVQAIFHKFNFDLPELRYGPKEPSYNVPESLSTIEHAIAESLNRLRKYSPRHTSYIPEVKKYREVYDAVNSFLDIYDASSLLSQLNLKDGVFIKKDQIITKLKQVFIKEEKLPQRLVDVVFNQLRGKVENLVKSLSSDIFFEGEDVEGAPTRLYDLMMEKGVDVFNNFSMTAVDPDRSQILNNMFSGSKYDGFNFTGAVLTDIIISNCTFINAKFSNAQFKGSTIIHNNFQGADFSSANFREIEEFKDNNIEGANFENASLSPLIDKNVNIGEPVNLKSLVVTKEEMKEKGFRGKESFNHVGVSYDKSVPGYELDAKGESWVRYIYATQDTPFPRELFDKFKLHRSVPGEYSLGWIGGKWDSKTKILYVTEMQSDLMQRTYELSPKWLESEGYGKNHEFIKKGWDKLKSKLENYYDGWQYVFFNQAVREAKERGAKYIATPTSTYYKKKYPASPYQYYDKIVTQTVKDPETGEKRVEPKYPYREEGHWRFIPVDSIQVWASMEKLSWEKAESKLSSLKFSTDELTDAQKDAGNYKKKHVKKDGLDISIENEKGSIRSGTDPDGNEWSIKMKNDYGYIKGTVGKDKDHLDCFLSNDYKEGMPVFIVNQLTDKGGFDEHKIMLGFENKEDAEKAYLDNYEKGRDKYDKELVEMDMEDFKEWMKNKKETKKKAKESNLKLSWRELDLPKDKYEGYLAKIIDKKKGKIYYGVIIGKDYGVYTAILANNERKAIEKFNNLKAWFDKMEEEDKDPIEYVYRKFNIINLYENAYKIEPMYLVDKESTNTYLDSIISSQKLSWKELNIPDLFKNDVVEDYYGNKYKVIDFSKNYEDVAKYDSTGAGKEMLGYEPDIMEGKDYREFEDGSHEQITYVAVASMEREDYGQTYVFIYGDDGVVKVSFQKLSWKELSEFDEEKELRKRLNYLKEKENQRKIKELLPRVNEIREISTEIYADLLFYEEEWQRMGITTMEAFDIAESVVEDMTDEEVIEFYLDTTNKLSSFQKLSLDRVYWETYVDKFIHTFIKTQERLEPGLGSKKELAKDGFNFMMDEIPDEVKRDPEFPLIITELREKLIREGIGDIFDNTPSYLDRNRGGEGDQLVDPQGEPIEETTGPEEVNYREEESVEDVNSLLDQLSKAQEEGNEEEVEKIKEKLDRIIGLSNLRFNQKKKGWQDIKLTPLADEIHKQQFLDKLNKDAYDDYRKTRYTQERPNFYIDLIPITSQDSINIITAQGGAMIDYRGEYNFKYYYIGERETEYGEVWDIIGERGLDDYEILSAGIGEKPTLLNVSKKLSWQEPPMHDKEKLEQVLQMLNEDLKDTKQIYTWIGSVTPDKFIYLVNKLTSALIDYSNFDFTSFYIAKRLYNYGIEVYDLIGVRDDNTYEVAVPGLGKDDLTVTSFKKLSWHIADPLQVTADIIFNKVLPYLDERIKTEQDDDLFTMLVKDKKDWFKIALLLEEGKEEEAKLKFNNLDTSSKEDIFKNLNINEVQYVSNVFDTELNERADLDKKGVQEDLQNFKKDPYKDLHFNYDRDRGQMINKYEPGEGEGTALNPLDMQQVYDTDFFEPDLDQWDEANETLDWQDRSNLQFGV